MNTYLTIWRVGWSTVTRAKTIGQLFDSLYQEDNPLEEGTATYKLPGDWQSIFVNELSDIIIELQNQHTVPVDTLPKVNFNLITRHQFAGEK